MVPATACLVLSLDLDPDPYTFACDGDLLGIPHFWNVVTNLPYLVIGLWGLHLLARHRLLGAPAFRNWTGIWISTALVCVGSGLYHWFLTPWALGLDRIAICGVIAFLAAHVLHVVLRIGPSLGLSLGLLAACEATVIAWYLGASPWWYGALQAIAGLGTLAIVLVWHRRGRHTFSPKPLYLFCGYYALAKLLELLDQPICDLTGVLGGHPLKHLASAIGLACLGRLMIQEARARAGATA